MLSHRGDELGNVHGLGDVAVEPGSQEPLTVAAHRLGGDREDGGGRRPYVRSELPERLDAVDIREPDVHEDEVGCVLEREATASAPLVASSVR